MSNVLKNLERYQTDPEFKAQVDSTFYVKYGANVDASDAINKVNELLSTTYADPIDNATVEFTKLHATSSLAESTEETAKMQRAAAGPWLIKPLPTFRELLVKSPMTDFELAQMIVANHPEKSPDPLVLGAAQMILQERRLKVKNLLKIALSKIAENTGYDLAGMDEYFEEVATISRTLSKIERQEIFASKIPMNNHPNPRIPDNDPALKEAVQDSKENTITNPQGC